MLEKALQASYTTLSPHSNRQIWEFDSNLFHLKTIVNNSSQTDNIIDVGCGIGILALALKKLGYNVIGIDKYVFEPNNSYNVADIESLKKIWKREGLEISSGDVLSTGTQSNFDFVISVAVIEHQKNLKGFFENLCGYAKKNGKLYIATPNASNLLNRFRMFFGRAPMANIEPFFKSGETFNGHWREYTPHELQKIAEISGLKVLEVGGTQTTKPHFSKNIMKWYVSLARLLAYVIPGTGDTAYVVIQK